MTLVDFMGFRGWLPAGGGVGRKVRCPFHGSDSNPSAILNANSLFCFAEHRLYTLRDFEDVFSVSLDRVEESTEKGGLLIKGGFMYGEVLFTREVWD